MAIKYSLSARPVNPSEKNSKRLVYPMAQYDELVDLSELASPPALFLRTAYTLLYIETIEAIEAIKTIKL